MPLTDLDSVIKDVKVGSMWDKSSPLSTEYNRLWDELVPESGMSSTTDGEALRSIFRLYYDLYNNGGINSTMPHYYGFILFIIEWCGNLPIGDQSGEEYLYLIRETLESCQEKDERWSDEYDDDVSYRLFENHKYKEAIEIAAHWVTWLVSTRMGSKKDD